MLKHYQQINELYEANGFPLRAADPLFHIFTMNEPYPTLVRAMPPHVLDFYQVGFQENMPGTELSVETAVIRERSNLLYAIAPGQTLSWVRGQPTKGHILYFKPELLAFYPFVLEEQFSFLRPTAINITAVEAGDSDEFHDELARLCQLMHQPIPYKQQVIQSRLLAFLFRCKGVFEREAQQQALLPPAQQLTLKFRQLVNKFFVQHGRVEVYADWLNVSPNYLSAVLRQTTGRSAKALLNERRLLESQNLLRYTTADVAEIADQLGFSEATHFTRFFRKQTGLTPGEFRTDVVNIGRLSAEMG